MKSIYNTLRRIENKLGLDDKGEINLIILHPGQTEEGELAKLPPQKSQNGILLIMDLRGEREDKMKRRSRESKRNALESEIHRLKTELAEEGISEVDLNKFLGEREEQSAVPRVEPEEARDPD